jgi:hypothetical protein
MEKVVHRFEIFRTIFYFIFLVWEGPFIAGQNLEGF